MGLAGGLAANGVLSGGGGGVSSAAVTWAQQEQARIAALGLTGQTFDPFGAANFGSITPASQQVVGGLVGAVAGQVITNIWVLTNTPGAGTVPAGGIFLGLYTTAGVRLALTADVSADPKWLAAANFQGFALTSPFTFTVTGGYYLAFLENGVWGTTQMKLQTAATNATLAEHSPSGVSSSVQQTSQATLPAPAVFAQTNNTLTWFGWS